MSEKINVGVIFGGQSPEHEVSIVSAESVIAAFDVKKYSINPIFIDRAGRWFTGISPNEVSQLDSGKAAAVDIMSAVHVLPSESGRESHRPWEQAHTLTASSLFRIEINNGVHVSDVGIFLQGVEYCFVILFGI